MGAFIKPSVDKKSIKMSEEKHVATISLFGVKILVGYSNEEKTFSFGFNSNKLVKKAKHLFNTVLDYFRKNENIKFDDNMTLEAIKEELREDVAPDVDKEELTVSSSNYVATVKLFGLGIIFSYNKKYKNFINFKQDRVKETYNEVKNLTKQGKVTE